MAVWLVVKKWLSSHLFKLSNRSLLIFSGLYVSLSWWLLVLAG
ncbi:two pore domain potassium channel family protein, partial [Vibrio parahaemolyticus]|nr:two pore domain potassium channel family protein [Vibrio parahaemolyticus]